MVLLRLCIFITPTATNGTHMTKLIELQSQIDKLQKEAAAIKAKEFDSTVRDILAKMSAFGITFKDLKPGKAGKAIGTKKAGGKKKSGVTLPAKYRGPNGETWTGRGLAPRWLQAELAQGKTKEEFAVQEYLQGNL